MAWDLFFPISPQPFPVACRCRTLKMPRFFFFLNNRLSGFGSALAWVQGLALMSLVPTGCETKAEIHSSSSFSPYPLQSAPNQSPPFPSALPPSHSSAFCSSSLVNLGGAAVHLMGFDWALSVGSCTGHPSTYSGQGCHVLCPYAAVYTPMKRATREVISHLGDPWSLGRVLERRHFLVIEQGFLEEVADLGHWKNVGSEPWAGQRHLRHLVWEGLEFAPVG